MNGADFMNGSDIICSNAIPVAHDKQGERGAILPAALSGRE